MPGTGVLDRLGLNTATCSGLLCSSCAFPGALRARARAHTHGRVPLSWRWGLRLSRQRNPHVPAGHLTMSLILDTGSLWSRRAGRRRHPACGYPAPRRGRAHRGAEPREKRHDPGSVLLPGYRPGHLSVGTLSAGSQSLLAPRSHATTGCQPELGALAAFWCPSPESQDSPHTDASRQMLLSPAERRGRRGRILRFPRLPESRWTRLTAQGGEAGREVAARQ
nr:uncharacterized protein LOC105491957 [Macaca nemestrina]